MIGLTALKRAIPVPQWNVLAFLQRAGGTGNAAIVRAKFGATIADLMELVDQEVVGVYHNGAEVDLRRWTFLPLLDLRLTPKGREVAAQIVAVAGILLLLSRHRQAGVTVPRLIEASGEPLETIREMADLRMVELVRASGSLQPVDVSTARATSADVAVKVTGTGMRYTTEAQR